MKHIHKVKVNIRWFPRFFHVFCFKKKKKKKTAGPEHTVGIYMQRHVIGLGYGFPLREKIALPLQPDSCEKRHFLHELYVYMRYYTCTPAFQKPYDIALI